MIGQTQFGYVTFPQSRAFEVLESQFMTLPLKECAITSDIANTILLKHPDEGPYTYHIYGTFVHTVYGVYTYLCKCSLMPHIICCWKALIKIILDAAYTALLHPQFLAHIQYLCKRSFSIRFKEYAITLHIIHIMPHTICRWKALIKIILNVRYTALVDSRFWLHLQYFCIHCFTLM